MAYAKPEQTAAALYSVSLHYRLGSFLNKVSDRMAEKFLSVQERNLIEQKILARRRLKMGLRSEYPAELTRRPQR